MKVDWQAYLDGSLSVEDRAAADQMLASDPDSRAELDGLRSFVDQIRVQGRAEVVPTITAAELLNRPKINRTSPLARLAVAAACLALAFFLINNVLLDPDRPNRKWWASGWLATNDATNARTWLRTKVDQFMPDVDSPDGAKLKGACFGDDWACLVYEKSGDQYRLYASQDSERFINAEEVPTSPSLPPLYNTRRGTGWVQNSTAFYIDGPQPSVRESIATKIASVVATMDPRDCR